MGSMTSIRYANIGVAVNLRYILHKLIPSSSGPYSGWVVTGLLQVKSILLLTMWII